MGDSLTFSAKNRSIFLQKARSSPIDFVMTSCDLKEALFCLLASKAGKKCAIFIADDFHSELNLIVDHKNVKDKATSVFRDQFPHLILPDEYLHIQESNAFKKLLPQHIREKDVAKYESQIHFSSKEMVSLEKEFKISSQRLLLSIIKNAVKQGAIILNYMDCNLLHEQEMEVRDQIKGNLAKVHFKQLLSFSEQENTWKYFNYYLNKKNLYLKRSLKFHVNEQELRFIRFQDYFLLHGKISDYKRDLKQEVLSRINEIINIEESFKEDDILSTEIKECSEANQLKSVLKACEKICKDHLNWSSGDFTTALSQINAFDTRFENRKEIQLLIEFADFKYDEAKQTGVTPVCFKNSFYRFGSEIEEITEKAYELRNQFGPGDQLWFYVQFLYCFENEMVNSMADFKNRLNNNHSKKEENITDNKDFIEKILLSFPD